MDAENKIEKKVTEKIYRMPCYNQNWEVIEKP